MTGLRRRVRHREGRPGWAVANDPFAVLGLDAGADLADDDVRAAWRRIAAATHPDRADGGDPDQFAVAAAAYTELRTRYGRGEARAALTSAARIAVGQPDTAGPARRAAAATALGAVGARLRRGRPVRVALRLAAAAAAALAVLASSPGPAGPALLVGLLTWLALTIRRDLGPPPGS
jgi:hypothetical protein